MYMSAYECVNLDSQLSHVHDNFNKWNSFMNWLNKQRHPLFIVGSREKDFIQFYLLNGLKLLYDPKFVCSHIPMSHHKNSFSADSSFQINKILLQDQLI